MNNEPSGEYYDWTITGKPERPWLLPYHQTVVMKVFLARRDEDWKDVKTVSLSRISQKELETKESIDVVDGNVTISVNARNAFVVKPE